MENTKTKRQLAALATLLALLGLGILLFGKASLQRASLLLTTNPVPATEDALAYGAGLFAKQCSTCHGNPKDPQGEPMVIGDQRVPDFRDLNRPASVLAMRITFGVGEAMPAWDDVLTRDEIWHLVTYVMSFQRAGGGWRQLDN
jgi:mono/diheme cytochrome c family protein